MFSRVEIIGHLGGDPETRFTQNGASVCSFNVASNRAWTNNDGSKGEETTWWRVSAWGRLGEVCQQYLTKGQLIFVEGQLKPDRETGRPSVWTDQNGQPRASYELRASSMKMLGRRDGYGGGSQQGYQNQNQGYRQQNQGYTQGARQAAPQQRQAQQQRQAPAQQRPPQQSAGGQAPTRQGPPPAQRSDPPRQQAPNPGARRSTTSAPQSNEFGDDNFGPDEIPF
jgi:single-strand DNA-binding protein